MATHNYTEASIRSLDWREHIRLRPGMYIGKLGDGSAQDDGIYVLLKEIIDNSIDEYVTGHGKRIDLQVPDHCVTVRDYGRDIPMGKVIDCVSKINTGGKYDSISFQKSVGLNGIGTKAVNALSTYFYVQAFRSGQTKAASFQQGILTEDAPLQSTQEPDGLRYRKIVVATDADVDGMHIRLLLLTYFLQFFPDLVRNRHVYLLETPLFRVRNQKETRYCYSEVEKQAAMAQLGPQPEITCFKGLGEISADEFQHFIGKDIRLEPVALQKDTHTQQFLTFYMGKNTLNRQHFIIDNLRVEQEPQMSDP